MTVTLELVGDAARFDAVYRTFGNQRDNLCGCYWANLAVVAHAGGTEPDEELAALHAGCVVPDGPTRPEFSLPWGGQHSGAQPTWPYRLALASSNDDDAIGTSPSGIIRAVDLLSGGALSCVALRSERWSSAQVLGFITGCAALGPIPLVLVANVATRHLVGTLDQRLATMVEAMHGTTTLDAEPDWDVGHFGSLAGLASGPGGEFVIWRDTYKPMGERGYSLQPTSAVAEALHRDGTGAGGVLAIAGAAHADSIRAVGQRLGLVEAVWSNGSPDPAND